MAKCVSPSQSNDQFTVRWWLLILAIGLPGIEGCGPKASTPRLPKPIDVRQPVAVDVGEIDTSANAIQIPAIQGLKIRTNQKLRLVGWYRATADIPLIASFHSSQPTDPETNMQTAAPVEQRHENGAVKFVIEIGSPTPRGGSFVLKLRSGKQVFATGSVSIAP